MPEQVPIADCRAFVDKLRELEKEGRVYREHPTDETTSGNLTDVARAVYVHLLEVVWREEAPKGRATFSLGPSRRALKGMLLAAEEFLAVFTEPRQSLPKLQLESLVIPVETCLLLLVKFRELREDQRLFVEQPERYSTAGNLTDIARAVFLHLLHFIWKDQNPYGPHPSPSSLDSVIESATEFLNIYLERPMEL